MPSAEAIDMSTRPAGAMPSPSSGASKVFNAGSDRARSTRSSTSTSPSRAGEFVSLIGPSGLRQVDAAAPDRQPHRADARATITVNGKPADRARLDQDYGMAFQQAGLFDWRSVVQATSSCRWS